VADGLVTVDEVGAVSRFHPYIARAETAYEMRFKLYLRFCMFFDRKLRMKMT